ncbi:MAG: hypothetical protein ACC700_19845 [Anaerolineales bacterium]
MDMDLAAFTLDELAELLKVTNKGSERRPIVQEIVKRQKSGEVMQESHVTQEEQSSAMLTLGILITLFAVAGICIIVLIL